MPTNPDFTFAVIGRGMIGSAAARHLAKLGHSVALIGPGEPADFSTHSGVFGSHYDEGRITRVFDPDAKFWRDVNRASIARYAEIAAESGVAFYRDVGVLHVGSRDDTNVERVGEICDDEAIAYEVFEGADLAARFPFLAETTGKRGYFEPRNAGYISPRRLVHAQTLAAERAGASIVDDFAVSLSEASHGVSIKTRSGSVAAERVLVAAGGHTQSLIGQSLNQNVYARTVALFRLSAAQARRLAGMPSMRCIGPEGNNPYILPPIPYPDGNVWLKLGGDPVDVVLNDGAEIQRWFQSGGSVPVADRLQEMLCERIRDFTFEERRVVPCMTTYGDTGLPSIGPVSDRVAVATGCYGKSAKCSDELGRLAAMALLGECHEELAARR